MAALNLSSEIGGVIAEFSTSVSGNLFLTLFSIIIFLLALCIAFRIPMFMSAAIVLPMLLISLVITTQVMPIFGVFIIYIAFLSAKYFILD